MADVPAPRRFITGLDEIERVHHEWRRTSYPYPGSPEAVAMSRMGDLIDAHRRLLARFAEEDARRDRDYVERDKYHAVMEHPCCCALYRVMPAKEENRR